MICCYASFVPYSWSALYQNLIRNFVAEHSIGLHLGQHPDWESLVEAHLRSRSRGKFQHCECLFLLCCSHWSILNYRVRFPNESRWRWSTYFLKTEDQLPQYFCPLAFSWSIDGFLHESSHHYSSFFLESCWYWKLSCSCWPSLIFHIVFAHFMDWR